MHIEFSDQTPIYLQLAEAIEDDILKDIFQEEEQIISTTEMATFFRINPATAAKGVNLLVDRGILYKKRGVGMFVHAGSKQKILDHRKKMFFDHFIASLLDEAAKLHIGKKELIEMIERGKER